MTSPARHGRPRPDPASAPPPIESYLAEVAAALPGGTRSHADVIPELRGGLLDAADAYEHAGLAPCAAARAAVHEFGNAAEVAAAFRPGLAAGRAATALLVTGPLIGMLWAAAARASHIGVRDAPPWDWAHTLPGARIAVPLIVAVLMITVWAALCAVAATGRLARWIPDRPRLAPAAAGIAGLGAATIDVILLVLLASQLARAPATLSAAPVAMAAVASAARLLLAGRTGRGCLGSLEALS